MVSSVPHVARWQNSRSLRCATLRLRSPLASQRERCRSRQVMIVWRQRAGPAAAGQGCQPAEPGASSASLDGGWAVRHATCHAVMVPCPLHRCAKASLLDVSSARNVRINVDFAWFLGIRTLRVKNAHCAKVLILPRFFLVRPGRTLRLLSCTLNWAVRPALPPCSGLSAARDCSNQVRDHLSACIRSTRVAMMREFPVNVCKSRRRCCFKSSIRVQ